jgi:transcriptional regulator
MSAPIPAAGFRSRTEAVLQLRKLGLSDAEIAQKLDVTPKTVAALASSATRRAPRPSERDGRTVVIARETMFRLAPHAQARDISANELVRRLVETALDDGMIDAVLDDGAAE